MENGQETIMQISRIEIKNLFGMFDHDINLKTKDRITIIHGPNGVGKTTVLKLIQDVFSAKFFALQAVHFKQISITFSNKQKLEVVRGTGGKLTLVLSKGKSVLEKFPLEYKSSGKEVGEHIPLGAIEDFLPNLNRVAAQLWFDENSNDTISLDEVMYRYGDREIGRAHV
jgi:predicted ATPase